MLRRLVRAAMETLFVRSKPRSRAILILLDESQKNGRFLQHHLLRSWKLPEVFYVPADTNGIFTFEDTNAPSFDRRFYRWYVPWRGNPRSKSPEIRKNRAAETKRVGNRMVGRRIQAGNA